MPLNKRELTELLLGIIGDIGEKKNDGFVYVKREKLLLKWEACGQGKFTDHGQGKISKFLQNDLSMQIVSNDRYRLDQLLIPDLDDEQQRRLPLATREKTTDLTTSDIGTHNLITLSELKNKVYNMILTFVKRTWSSEQCDQKFRTVSLEELNKEWQKLNPNKKFKDYKHGTFKLFLIEKCHLTGSGKDDFEVNIRFIETQIQDLSKESDGSNADNSRVSVKNQLPSKSSYSPQQQIGQGGVFRPGSQSNTCIQQSGIQKPTLASNHPSEATSISDARLQCSGLSTRGTRALANDKLPESRISQSRRYYMQLLSGLFECGLKALRQLFMEIHPNWKNTPNDIRTFEQGTLQVKGKSETDKFKSGDIDKWDISLITKVLLYSKKSKEKLGSDARFQRCRGAVETISTIRNYVQGHSASGELTKSEHENQMKKLRKAVVNDLGFDEAVFDKSIEDADLLKDNQFFTSHHEEVLSKLTEIKEMLTKIENGTLPQKEIYHQAESEIPNWYEWVEVQKKLRRLDTDKNQYILIVDKLNEVEDEHLRILANVNWELVLDLDPNSDNNGLLTQFKSVGAIVSPLLPNQLKGVSQDILPQPNMIQWVHANGRSIELTEEQEENRREISAFNKNEPRDTIYEWEMNFRPLVHDLIHILFEKCDKMKPKFCVVLGIRSGLSSEIASLILKDINARCNIMDFELKLVSIDSELDMTMFPNATASGLLIFHFLIGLAGLTGKSLKTSYFLPSGKKDCLVPLDAKHYSALSEYMEVLYDGCEDIPEGLYDEELESFEKEHLKNFISGDLITFQSLNFRHDAHRDLTNEIVGEIRSIAESAQKAYIVQIKHAPGSGGSTLARRVLWDLHKKFPCVIIKMDLALLDFGQNSYGETYIENLCKRISKLHEICKVALVILMDGNSSQVSTLSSCVSRKLKRTPMVIIRCVKYQESSRTHKSNKETKDNTVARDFHLDPVLKENSPEYSEFSKKYDHYCTLFSEAKGASGQLRKRVFHFPMLALLGKFTKLEGIVSDSLASLTAHNQKEYEIAIVVAFLQKYADEPTPASLISNYILECSDTYEKMANRFSKTLMNLMIPGKPHGGKRFIGSAYSKGSDDCQEEASHQCVMKHYTFQHHQVANAILQYSERNLQQITKDFLDYRILECYRSEKEITYVVDQLFLYHEAKNETHFSKLVSELASLYKKKKKESDADEIQLYVGTILVEAANQTKDATFYSHVARFFAYKWNDFAKARELIEEGLQIEKDIPSDRKRRVLDIYGHIVLNEMRVKDDEEEIENEDQLKEEVKEALDLFNKAKDIPPKNFPNPLIGKVKVWQFCFEYLIKRLDNDLQKFVEYTMEDEFFFDSVAECIDLLNEVDSMVMEFSVLPDPTRTKKNADFQRYTLMETFGKTRSSTKRQGFGETNLNRICQYIAEYKTTASQKYLIRLQASLLISEVKREFTRLKEKQKKDLFSWLENLVFEYKMYNFARDLLGVGAIQEKPPFQIDRALKVISKWQEIYPNDYFSYFYQYMLCFLKISEGKISGYKAKCETGIAHCDRWTKENMRRHQNQFFMGKKGREICKLVSFSQLRQYAETCKRTHGEETINNDDMLDQTFWKDHCRKYLFECKGRIQPFKSAGGRSPQPYINLEPGNIKIGVQAHDIGTLDIDYRRDTKVSFVVAFTLAGPKAKAVEIIDGLSKATVTDGKFSRQGSKIEQQQC